MRAFFVGAIGVAIIGLFACNDDNPCGLVPPNTSSIDFDVSSMPNSPCTVVVSNDVKAVTFAVAAPSAPLPSSPPDAGFVHDLCDSDAGVNVAVTPSVDGVQACRSANELSILQTALMGEFYSYDTGRCDVRVSLICGGQTLVSQQQWSVCHIAC